MTELFEKDVLLIQLLTATKTQDLWDGSKGTRLKPARLKQATKQAELWLTKTDRQVLLIQYAFLSRQGSRLQ